MKGNMFLRHTINVSVLLNVLVRRGLWWYVKVLNTEFMQLLDYFIALNKTCIPQNFLPAVFQNINTEMGGHFGRWRLYWAIKQNPGV